MSLRVGLDALEPDSAGAERVARLKSVAAESIEDVRRLAHGRRPAVLDDIGLTAALARLTETFGPGSTGCAWS